ncbi:ATP-binding protein [Larkinella insperata]|uniref:histidine kinase n=1 Tax=Larkinella insperata TaxID=332158 RepID=A0ABW3Q3A4_9BACT|nr:ATP-binding protein [Larkinella insperata]
MKKTVLLLVVLLTARVCLAQHKDLDSLRAQLKSPALADTMRVKILFRLGYALTETKRDTARAYLDEALSLAQRSHYPKGEVNILLSLAYLNLEKEPQLAIRQLLRARQIAWQLPDPGLRFRVDSVLGYFHNALQEYRKGIDYYRRSLGSLSPTDTVNRVSVYINIGHLYERLDRLDSARHFLLQALPMSQRASPGALAYAYYCLGLVEEKEDQPNQALNHYRQSLKAATAVGDRKSMREATLLLGQVFYRLNQPDSSLLYSRRAYALGKDNPYSSGMQTNSQLLATLFMDKGRLDSALFYQELNSTIKDSIYSQEKQRDVQTQLFREQQREQALREEQRAFESQVKIYGLLGGMAVLLLLAVVLFRNNRRQQRTNALLDRQNQQIQQQHDQLADSLTSLQRTQAQLIQREKMASLGELTAGIAHEIQNPLNFVNNFSELSSELLDELRTGPLQHLPTGEQPYAAEILGDLSQNLAKIHHHGQRADAIVKGMLEHSRSATGRKGPTDLNALVEEYLRLAYHGQQAQDSGFTAQLVTELDSALGRMDLHPQDISRVLLNLYNNAFYAVRQQQRKAETGSYHPTITVRTERSGGRAIIRIRDNGTGIPETVQQKIFQPFFTTKPTGQGTGLGLSLSYDIITNGHGGRIDVSSQEGHGAEFVIELPVEVPLPEIAGEK